MKLDLAIFRSFRRAEIGKPQRLFVIALLINNPAQRIGNRGIVAATRASHAGQIGSALANREISPRRDSRDYLTRERHRD